MAAEASRKLNELSPETLALAEAQARQAGLSLHEWLGRLISGHQIGQGSRSPASVALEYAFRTGSDRFFPSAPLHALVPSLDMDIWQAYTSSLRPAQPYAFSMWPDYLTEPGDVRATHDPASRVLRLVYDFQTRIDFGAVLLSAAFVEAAVKDFPPRQKLRVRRRAPTWYGEVVYRCLERSREVRNALVHHWQPTPRAERLALDAFVVLTDLTPASTELLRLCQYNRPRAFAELAKHLDAATDQLELSANLLAEVETASGRRPETAEQRLSSLQLALLDKAGGGLSLTEASDLVGISRQAMHKRIKAQSALGIMVGAELVLPRVQFVQDGEGAKLVPDLAPVLKLFDVAGGWSALQFLLENDPNVGDAPLNALQAGRLEDVLNAARAYLDVDGE